jgi:Tfp pilus assembly protein PilF
LLETTLTDSVRVLGPDHPSTLSTRANLANVYLQQGRTDQASALLETTLADSDRILGPHHWLTQVLRERLDSLLRSSGGAN